MKPRVYSQGSFDILHGGHVLFLWRASRLGALTVGLLSDESYEAYRGYPPVMPYEQRAAVVGAIGYVDKVIQTDHRRTKSDLQYLRPRIVVISTDWYQRDIYRQWDVTQQWLDMMNITLAYLPHTNGISSTQIKECIRGGHLAENGRRDNAGWKFPAEAVSG